MEDSMASSCSHNDVKDVMAMIRRERHLAAMLFDEHVALIASSTQPDDIDSDNVDDSEEKILLLQEHIHDALADNELHKIYMNRLLSNAAVNRVIFTHAPSQRTDDDVRLARQLARKDELSEQCLSIATALNEKAKQCRQFTASIADMLRDNRRVMVEITTAEDRLSSENMNINNESHNIEELQRQLESFTQRDRIARQVFQHLIIESAVDWAQDEELLEIMLNIDSE